MQNLVAKHGKDKVKAGTLEGKTYDSLTYDVLRRAASRYSGDAEFRKYARAYCLLKDMSADNEVLPCVPVLAKPDTPTEESTSEWTKQSWWSLVKRLLEVRHLRYACIFLCLAFLFRPSVSTVVTKLLVSTARLAFRRVVVFLSMLVDGLMDEVIFQLDHTVREALPAGLSVPETARESFNLLGHVISGSLGAAITFLFTTRRMGVQG